MSDTQILTPSYNYDLYLPPILILVIDVLQSTSSQFVQVSKTCQISFTGSHS